MIYMRHSADTIKSSSISYKSPLPEEVCRNNWVLCIAVPAWLDNFSIKGGEVLISGRNTYVISNNSEININIHVAIKSCLMHSSGPDSSSTIR